MLIHAFVWRKCWIYMLAMGIILSISQLAPAAPYQPQNPITIHSEYIQPNRVSQRVWRIIPESSQDTHTLRFYPKSADKRICEIKFLFDKGSFHQVIWNGLGKKERVEKRPFLILPGFPAPCNLIPVDETISEIRYEKRKKAAGRTFIQRYRMEWRQFSRSDCVKNGWLKEKYAIPETEKLQMATVYDAQGRTILRQLWDENQSWWYYEETLDRRSWRIPQPLQTDQ